NISTIGEAQEKSVGSASFRVGAKEYFIPMSSAVDVEAEIEKLEEELVYVEGFLKSVRGKLANERFVNNAPEKVVAVEKQKEADALAKIATIRESLANLQKK